MPQIQGSEEQGSWNDRGRVGARLSWSNGASLFAPVAWMWRPKPRIHDPAALEMSVPQPCEDDASPPGILSDYAPRIVLAAVIGIGAALLTFGGVFVFTSMRGAGLDFLIVVGFVLSILVGLASSFELPIS
jgi:hypothetical protein